jgi:hypothetical protein
MTVQGSMFSAAHARVFNCIDKRKKLYISPSELGNMKNGYGCTICEIRTCISVLRLFQFRDVEN